MKKSAVEMEGLQGKSRDIWVTCMMLISDSTMKGMIYPFCIRDLWEEPESGEGVSLSLSEKVSLTENLMK